MGKSEEEKILFFFPVHSSIMSGSVTKSINFSPNYIATGIFWPNARKNWCGVKVFFPHFFFGDIILCGVPLFFRTLDSTVNIF